MHPILSIPSPQKIHRCRELGALRNRCLRIAAMSGYTCVGVHVRHECVGQGWSSVVNAAYGCIAVARSSGIGFRETKTWLHMCEVVVTMLAQGARKGRAKFIVSPRRFWRQILHLSRHLRSRLIPTAYQPTTWMDALLENNCVGDIFLSSRERLIRIYDKICSHNGATIC